jgi:hypothetical protein
MEIAAAHSMAGNVVEEHHEEVVIAPAPPPPAPVVIPVAPAPATVVVAPPAAPVIVDIVPPAAPVAPPPVEVEVVKKTVIRDVSPARSHTSYTTSTTGASHGPVIIDHREVSEEIPFGPYALAHRRRSRSRSGREIRAEIKALEAELAVRRRPKGDIVHAERLSDGQLVLFEERVEKIEEGHRGPRIEKDRKGRMSISVPKYR